MPLRSVICVNEEICTGCARCAMSCHGSAIEVDDGKARLVDGQLCDGLGDCLDECPNGALYLDLRDVADYDETEVRRRIASKVKDCIPVQGQNGGPVRMPREGALNWPLKLEMAGDCLRLPGMMELVVAGDCAGYLCADTKDSVRDKALLLCCPKLEERSSMVSALECVLRNNDVRKVTILRVDMPCCSRLRGIVKAAMLSCDKDIPLEFRNVGV